MSSCYNADRGYDDGIECCSIDANKLHHGDNESMQEGEEALKIASAYNDTIHILIIACDPRGKKDVAAKSSRYQDVDGLLRTIQRYGMVNIQDEIIVHIFTDNPKILMEDFLQTQSTSRLISSLDIRVHAIPEPQSPEEDYHKFRTCASARLYAPYLFTTAYGENDLPKQILYLDTDILVTAPLRGLWDIGKVQFRDNPQALFGFSQEGIGGMVQKDQVPYNGGEAIYLAGTVRGFNTGVLLAHLHRWRDQNFSEMVIEQEMHSAENNYEMLFGDQGILNAMAARFPERHFELPCYWNMRTDTMRLCIGIYLDNAGGVIHGNRLIFHHHRENGIPAVIDLHNYLVRDRDHISSKQLQVLWENIERYENDGENFIYPKDIKIASSPYVINELCAKMLKHLLIRGTVDVMT